MIATGLARRRRRAGRWRRSPARPPALGAGLVVGRARSARAPTPRAAARWWRGSGARPARPRPRPAPHVHAARRRDRRRPCCRWPPTRGGARGGAAGAGRRAASSGSLAACLAACAGRRGRPRRAPRRPPRTAGARCATRPSGGCRWAPRSVVLAQISLLSFLALYLHEERGWSVDGAPPWRSPRCSSAARSRGWRRGPGRTGSASRIRPAARARAGGRRSPWRVAAALLWRRPTPLAAAALVVAGVLSMAGNGVSFAAAAEMAGPRPRRHGPRPAEHGPGGGGGGRAPRVRRGRGAALMAGGLRARRRGALGGLGRAGAARPARSAARA